MFSPRAESGARRIVVVGAGVVGLSLARELALRGERVTVLERASPAGAERAGGTTVGAATAVAVTAGAASAAALGVLSLPDGRRSALGRLHALAYRRYPDFAHALAEETGVDIGFRVPGALRLERAPPPASTREKAAARYRRAGFAAGWLEGDALGALAPGVSPDFRAALHLPDEAIVHPPDLRRALLLAARARGAEVREGVEARLEAEPAAGGELRIAIAPAAPSAGAGPTPCAEGTSGAPAGEVIPCDLCVLAAGSWTPRALCPPAPASSDRVPIRPIRGQIIEVRRDAPAGPSLRFHSERHERDYYIVHRRGGVLWLGSTVEDAGFDAGTTEAGREELASVLREVFPAARAEDVLRIWSGLRPQALRRGGPLLGRLPERPGVWVAAGHYRSGILDGPVSAELLAREILGAWRAGSGDDAAERELLRAFSP